VTTPSGNESPDWRRVTANEPCLVCGHDSWCTVSPDGNVVRCKQKESDKPSPGDDGEAWLHFIGSDSKTHHAHFRGPPPRSESASDTNWGAIASQFASAITEVQIVTLATHLHVDPIAVREIGTGYDEATAAYSMPMYAATGAVCGVQRRWINTSGGPDRKEAMTGCKLGVFRSRQPDDGLLVVCEGASDTLAALSLGYEAIGTASAGTCVDIVAAYARGRDILIIADANDVGRKSAVRIAAACAHGS
jgi:hypothetical protein